MESIAYLILFVLSVAYLFRLWIAHIDFKSARQYFESHADEDSIAEMRDRTRSMNSLNLYRVRAWAITYRLMGDEANRNNDEE